MKDNVYTYPEDLHSKYIFSVWLYLLPGVALIAGKLVEMSEWLEWDKSDN